MLVPMATMRTGSTPPQPISLVAPPLPVQNGAQPGSKVREQLQSQRLVSESALTLSYSIVSSLSKQRVNMGEMALSVRPCV